MLEFDYQTYEAALDKIRQRYQDFLAAGWSQADLTCCATKRYEHHGLALYLRPNQDLGRIWPWCCEILGSSTGNGERARLHFWRQMPLVQLLHCYGPDVIPDEIKRESGRIQ